MEILEEYVQYYPSNAKTDLFQERNTAAVFVLALNQPLFFENPDEWQVGLLEIFVPSTYFNIYPPFNKKILQISAYLTPERNVRDSALICSVDLEPGFYDIDQFVETVNDESNACITREVKKVLQSGQNLGNLTIKEMKQFLKEDGTEEESFDKLDDDDDNADPPRQPLLPSFVEPRRKPAEEDTPPPPKQISEEEGTPAHNNNNKPSPAATREEEATTPPAAHQPGNPPPRKKKQQKPPDPTTQQQQASSLSSPQTTEEEEKNTSNEEETTNTDKTPAITPPGQQEEEKRLSSTETPAQQEATVDSTEEEESKPPTEKRRRKKKESSEETTSEEEAAVRKRRRRRRKKKENKKQSDNVEQWSKELELILGEKIDKFRRGQRWNEEKATKQRQQGQITEDKEASTSVILDPESKEKILALEKKFTSEEKDIMLRFLTKIVEEIESETKKYDEGQPDSTNYQIQKDSLELEKELSVKIKEELKVLRETDPDTLAKLSLMSELAPGSTKGWEITKTAFPHIIREIAKYRRRKLDGKYGVPGLLEKEYDEHFGNRRAELNRRRAEELREGDTKGLLRRKRAIPSETPEVRDVIYSSKKAKMRFKLLQYKPQSNKLKINLMPDYFISCGSYRMQRLLGWTKLDNVINEGKFISESMIGEKGGKKMNVYSNETPEMKSFILPETCDFGRNNRSLYVYCNLVESSKVGNSSCPILRIVELNSTNLNDPVIYKYFDNPIFYQLNGSVFNKIEFSLCNGLGEPFPFQHGENSIIVLKFRRVKKIHNKTLAERLL